MLKSVYVEGRKPGMTNEAYRRLWREHGAIAMGLPDYFQYVRRYVQGDCLPDLPATLGASDEYDGVGELAYADAAARTQANRAPIIKEVLYPHAATFFGSTKPIWIVCEEQVLIPNRGTGIRAYSFIRRKPSLDGDAFRAAWDADVRRLMREPEIAGSCIGFNLNLAVDEGAPFDGFEEMSFASQAELEAAWEGLRQGSTARADQGAYADLGSRLTVIVQPITFHDEVAAA